MLSDIENVYRYTRVIAPFFLAIAIGNTINLIASNLKTSEAVNDSKKPIVSFYCFLLLIKIPNRLFKYYLNILTFRNIVENSLKLIILRLYISNL